MASTPTTLVEVCLTCPYWTRAGNFTACSRPSPRALLSCHLAWNSCWNWNLWLFSYLLQTRNKLLPSCEGWHRRRLLQAFKNDITLSLPKHLVILTGHTEHFADTAANMPVLNFRTQRSDVTLQQCWRNSPAQCHSFVGSFQRFVTVEPCQICDFK